MTTTPIEQDPEFVAISTVYVALKNLETEAQERVLNYVAAKLKLVLAKNDTLERSHAESGSVEEETELRQEEVPTDELGDEFEGISSIARKWLTRNGIQPNQIESLFSVGGDEIDLIADTVPGSSKREKMRSVFLLKGVAAYLGTGAARVSHEQMKETCLHYDAFDATNFATYFKTLASEVSGNKESGYSLTPRGLAMGAKMVKEMVKASKGAGD